MTNLEFIQKYISLAENAAKQLGISSLVVLAQWMLETARGTSFLDKVWNNLAGLENPNQKPTIFEHFTALDYFVIAYVKTMKNDCPALANANPTMSPIEVFSGSDYSGPDYGDLVEGIWLHSIVPGYQEYIKTLVAPTPAPVETPPVETPPVQTPEPVDTTIVTVPCSSGELTQSYKWDIPGALINPETGVGNSEFYITIDSGDFELLMSQTIADKLGLVAIGTAELSGVGGVPMTGNTYKVNVVLGSTPGETSVITDVNCIAIPSFLGLLFGSRTLVDRNIGVTLNPYTQKVTFFDAKG